MTHGKIGNCEALSRIQGSLSSTCRCASGATRSSTWKTLGQNFNSFANGVRANRNRSATRTSRRSEFRIGRRGGPGRFEDRPDQFANKALRAPPVREVGSPGTSVSGISRNRAICRCKPGGQQDRWRGHRDRRRVLVLRECRGVPGLLPPTRPILPSSSVLSFCDRWPTALDEALMGRVGGAVHRAYNLSSIAHQSFRRSNLVFC